MFSAIQADCYSFDRHTKCSKYYNINVLYNQMIEITFGNTRVRNDWRVKKQGSPQGAPARYEIAFSHNVSYCLKCSMQIFTDTSETCTIRFLFLFQENNEDLFLTYYPYDNINEHFHSLVCK